MEENKDKINETAAKTVKRASRLGFLKDGAAGFGMGVAFIIPGFSGGSIAAILGIYERLIEAIADIFKTFKKSVITLLPIFIGLVLGAVSLMFPLDWALDSFPLPTVSLFVGLALGGLPSITDKVKGKIKWTNLLALLIPIALAVGLSFAPTGADVDLLGLDFGGYVVLFFVGVIGSSALVIPGISGSMILLILGYYNPLLGMITENLLRGQNVGAALLVLSSAGAGIIFGFIGISVIMKLLLKKCPRGTYFAIIGFIVGSVPTVFVSTVKDAGMTASTLPSDPWHWTACVLLLALGGALSFILVKKTKAMAGKPAPKTNS